MAPVPCRALGEQNAICVVPPVPDSDRIHRRPSRSGNCLSHLLLRRLSFCHSIHWDGSDAAGSCIQTILLALLPEAVRPGLRCLSSRTRGRGTRIARGIVFCSCISISGSRIGPAPNRPDTSCMSVRVWYYCLNCCLYVSRVDDLRSALTFGFWQKGEKR